MFVSKSKQNTIAVAPLNSAVSYLLSSSLFIAAVATMTLFVTYLLYGIQPDIRLLLAVFFVTFSTYSINKITDKEEDAINLPDRSKFVTQHSQKIEGAAYGAMFAAIILASSRSFNALLIIISPLVIGFLYNVGISGFRLKNAKVLKTVVVTATWTFTAVMVPLLAAPSGVLQIFLVFWFLFVKLFINAILFDVRDIVGDAAKGVITLPAYLGKVRTRNFLLCLNSTLILWIVCAYFTGFFHKYLPLLAIFVLYGYWYITYFCQHLSGQNLPDLAVDGEWLLIVAGMLPLALW